jgi:hypothetical protein
MQEPNITVSRSIQESDNAATQIGESSRVKLEHTQ